MEIIPRNLINISNKLIDSNASSLTGVLMSTLNIE